MKEIFIVEDDDDIRELIQFLLEGEGYIVTSFSRVADFRNTLLVQMPDLVLLDIWLPDGDGREVCKQIQDFETTDHIPVVLMSANGSPKGTSHANDFIAKPFDVENFLQRIGKQLF